MEFRDTIYETDGRVAVITMNRPHYRNPVGRIQLEEIDQALLHAADDPEIRVAVLRGAGDHFSTGHDLGTPEKLEDDDLRPFPEGVRGEFERSWELYIDKGFRWRNLPIPTLAAVRGYCILGGWMVATAMDLIFASETAMFLGSEFQYFSVPWDVGVRNAKDILFQPRFIDASEAREMGLVSRVVPDDRLDEEVMSYAHRVAENDPFRLRLTKLAINQAQDAQGYTTAIISAHQTQFGGGSSRGARLPSGQRRIAPIDRARANYQAWKNAE